MRRVVGLLLTVGLATGTAALVAMPVSACAVGVCQSPTPTGTTVTAVDSIPGAPPQVTAHTNSGSSWTSVTTPSCPATTTYEPVGGASGIYGWTDPGGVTHLAHGSPPSPDGWNLAEYWVDAEYSRTMSPSPGCQPGPWLFDGFVATPVTFPTPTTTTPGVGPALKALEAEVEANLIGGEVQTAPATNALVNLPEYAWVAGSNIPSSLVKTTTVRYVPPGVGDREEVLTVAVAIQRIGVTWNWGDGQTTQAESPGGMGQPYPRDNISHVYTDVSVHGEHPSPYALVNARDEIPISATQQLQVSSWAIWVDATGRHQTQLGSFPLSIPVQPHWVRVGQIEGVPYCPTTKTCA